MQASDTKVSFGKFDFDERLQKVIAEMGWEKPTPVQVEMIPLMLNDKNILARARTGSGKTAAFLLPLIQKILHLTTNKSNTDEKNGGPFAMIVAPTKELATQIFEQLEKLIEPFPFIHCFNLAQYIDSHDHTLGNELLDIIIGTPGRLLATSSKTPDLFKRLHCVILDEADLLFSYGYQDEIKRLKLMLPSKYQTVMTSATLNEDLSQLKRDFVIGKVVSLKLKETDLPGLDQLEQFNISCKNDEERFTIFLALIKLKLLVGKCVIFVSSIDRCYKLHLFLQSFNVPSAVLNAQMPANSRCRIIHEFNQGRWPFLIASECNDIFDEAGEDDNQSEIKEEKEKTKKEKRKEIKRKSKHRQIDKESGTGRGIDFYLVPNVVNFDFPLSGDMYVHRVGRTARGYNKGTAISFSTEDEQKIFEQIKEEIDQRIWVCPPFPNQIDQNWIELVKMDALNVGMPVIKPYEIRIKDFEAFQLRARDVLAACTRTAIRETRMTEIREEILKSRRLDSYFAKNPRERWMLEQDRKKFKLNVHSPGIADVPDYIVPKALRGQNFNTGGESSNAFPVNRRKRMGQPAPNGADDDEELDGPKQKKFATKKHKFFKGTAKHKFQKQMNDPLRSFKF